jgi:hypothetical protein
VLVAVSPGDTPVYTCNPRAYAGIHDLQVVEIGLPGI